MKKLIAILLTTALTLGGMYLAFVANVEDAEPLSQGGLSIAAAVAFSAAILCAGWGQSLNWKGGRKNV